jgi:nitrate reductase NapD
VAGVLVHALPAHLDGVDARISRLAGASIHARSAAGKLVITLESERDGRIARQLAAIQRMRGVMSAVLVYEHSEPRESADQEITTCPTE